MCNCPVATSLLCTRSVFSIPSLSQACVMWCCKQRALFVLALVVCLAIHVRGVSGWLRVLLCADWVAPSPMQHAIMIAPKPRSGMRAEPGTKLQNLAAASPADGSVAALGCGGTANGDNGPELIPDENNVFEEGKSITGAVAQVLRLLATSFVLLVGSELEDDYHPRVVSGHPDCGELHRVRLVLPERFV